MKHIIDCKTVDSEADFWANYITTVKPEGGEFFGKNLDAFWDALSAGGPGFPGDGEQVIEFVNSTKLKKLKNGIFYKSLKQIAFDLNNSGSLVKLVLN